MSIGKVCLVLAFFCIVASASAHARYYDPVTGRFINRDPVDRVENQQGVGAPTVHVQTAGRFVSRGTAPTHFAGVNLYQYVDSKPTMFMDPMGLLKIPMCPEEHTLCINKCKATYPSDAQSISLELCYGRCNTILDENTPCPGVNPFPHVKPKPPPPPACPAPCPAAGKNNHKKCDQGDADFIDSSCCIWKCEWTQQARPRNDPPLSNLHEYVSTGKRDADCAKRKGW